MVCLFIHICLSCLVSRARLAGQLTRDDRDSINVRNAHDSRVVVNVRKRKQFLPLLEALDEQPVAHLQAISDTQVVELAGVGRQPAQVMQNLVAFVVRITGKNGNSEHMSVIITETNTQHPFW